LFLFLGSYISSWKNWMLWHAKPCVEFSSYKGCEFGEYSVWGYRGTSSIIGYISFKIGVAERHPATSGEPWISAKNNIRLEVIRCMGGALGQEIIGTIQYATYFPT
jgi:hypothetical protein